MATFVRVMVLLWADILAEYILFVMQTYLTNVWKLSFTHAAGILNIMGGIRMVLPLGFLFLADTILGDYYMLLLSSIAYSVGMGFLSMSTPPVLTCSTGTCKGYEPNCIGDTQKTLFYTALALIAVGVSGHMVSLKPFIAKQKTEDDGESSKIFFQIAGVCRGHLCDSRRYCSSIHKTMVDPLWSSRNLYFCGYTSLFDWFAFIQVV